MSVGHHERTDVVTHLLSLPYSRAVGAGPEVPSAAGKTTSSSHLLDQGWKWLNSLSLYVPFCPAFYTSHSASILSSSLPALASLRRLQEQHLAWSIHNKPFILPRSYCP